MARKLQFDTRPEVEVIVYRHRSNCRFSERKEDGRCRCPKHLYVRLARFRISAKTVAWETARQRAREWADNHDPAILRERERAVAQALVSKAIDEAFDAFIQAKQAANGSDAILSKYRTIKKQLTSFIDLQNRGKAEAERVLYVHQVTTPLLNQWMAAWSVKTYWAKSKKRDNTIAFLDFCLASKWIPETSSRDRGNAARGMAKIIGQKDSSIPTLPFIPAQFKAILVACARFDKSLLTVNRSEVAAKGKRLHALINLMRWSGLRTADKQYSLSNATRWCLSSHGHPPSGRLPTSGSLLVTAASAQPLPPVARAWPPVLAS